METEFNGPSFDPAVADDPNSPYVKYTPSAKVSFSGRGAYCDNFQRFVTTSNALLRLPKDV